MVENFCTATAVVLPRPRKQCNFTCITVIVPLYYMQMIWQNVSIIKYYLYKQYPIYPIWWPSLYVDWFQQTPIYLPTKINRQSIGFLYINKLLARYLFFKCCSSTYLLKLWPTRILLTVTLASRGSLHITFFQILAHCIHCNYL